MTAEIDVDADLAGQRELMAAVAALTQGEAVEPEENVPEEVPETVPEVDSPEEPAVEVDAASDDTEAKARADGWVSKDEWVAAGKPADKWKPADEFNRHGELYKQHKGDLVAKIDEQARLTQEMARMFREQQERAIAQARAEERAKVEEEMRDAWTRGDMDGYNKAHARKVAIDAPEQPQVPQIDPDIKAWGERNPWFTNGFDEVGIPTNPAAHAMTELTARYRQARPGDPAIRAVEYAERRVKEMYPEMFKPKAPPKATPPAVAATGRGDAVKPASQHMKLFASKSSAEQALIRQMAKASGMTLEQYMKDYK